jgi:glycine/D-amino acid oxidase-like deaminating enzyme
MSRGPSFWLDPAPRPGPALEGERSVDVVVVGAGYAGLSTAIALRERGVSVIVLEREFAGFGGSGRNAGHLTPTIGKDLPSLLRFYGRERAGALVRLADASVDHVEAAIADNEIECEYVDAGNVVAGTLESQRPKLEKAARVGIELGASLELLDDAQFAARGLPRSFVCGYVEQRGGVLNPGLYLRGMLRIARDRGAEVWERSGVVAIERIGGEVVARTQGGSVRARRLVVATNAFTRELGTPSGGPVALMVSLQVSEPLSPEQRQRVGWAGSEGIYTAHEILESHRLTAEGRVLSGSRYLRYGNGGAVLADDDPATYGKVDAMFRDRFPELGTIAVDRQWSGPIALNLSFLPWVGRSEDGVVSWAVGFAGHGISMASLAGTWLAALASDEEAGIEELTGVRRIPMPPAPVRAVVTRGIIRALEVADNRTDRRASRARPARSRR